MSNWCPENDGAYRDEVAATETESIAQLRSENAKLKEQVAHLKDYTRHDISCSQNSHPKRINEFEVERRPCSCGLADWLKEGV